MSVRSTSRRLVTRKKRVIVTDLQTNDEIVEFWRERYDRIFAAESRARRTWAQSLKTPKAPGQVEAEIQARQVEWDAYVRERLQDLTTAK